MANSQTIQAPSLKVYVNNTIFGIATNFKYSVSYGRRRIFGIDTQEAIEITSGSVIVMGSMDVVRLHDQPLEGYGMLPQLPDLSLEKYCSVSLLDMVTGAVVFSSNFVLFKNQSWQVKAKGVMTGTVTFDAIDFSNETSIGALD